MRSAVKQRFIRAIAKTKRSIRTEFPRAGLRFAGLTEVPRTPKSVLR